MIPPPAKTLTSSGCRRGGRRARSRYVIKRRTHLHIEIVPGLGPSRLPLAHRPKTPGRAGRTRAADPAGNVTITSWSSPCVVTSTRHHLSAARSVDVHRPRVLRKRKIADNHRRNQSGDRGEPRP